MFLLYRTDCRHSVTSKILIAICDAKEKVIDVAEEYCIQDHVFFSADDILNLELKSQTQGLKTNYELIVETLSVNQFV